MRRREFISLLGGAAAPSFLWPLATHAQQATMPVIGVLNNQTRDSETGRLAAIRQGLKETGFVEGQNAAIEYRFADGHTDRLPDLAAELVRRRVTVLLANTTPPAHAAKAATATIPIVFVAGVDPVELGLVASFNRPGANVTGVTFLVNKLVAKRLELLCDVVPGPAPIGMLADRNNPNTEADVRDAQAAAVVLGRTLHVAKVAAESELDTAFTALVQQRVAALFIAPNANFRIWRDRLFALAARHALPTSFSSSDFVRVGGLMSYGPDQLDAYRQAGIYAGRILKGEKPAELPVMQSAKFEFVINLKTAKALGLVVPRTLLALAEEVIE
jgi:putative tryptophan/tyrosine transport system substrate-binding protein